MPVLEDDVKIAGEHFISPSTPESDAEVFLAHKRNGNMKKARRLGTQLGQKLLKNYQTATTLRLQQLVVLSAYTIRSCAQEYAPDSILAQTILSAFYSTLEQRPLCLALASDESAFSLYMLAGRSLRGPSIGQVFAGLCGQAESDELAQDGQNFFEQLRGDLENTFARQAFSPSK